MRLNCAFKTPVTKTENPEDYVREVEFTVTAIGEDDDEYVVGRLAITHVLWTDAIAAGIPLAEVCDSDSQGLQDVHTIVAECKDGFRTDLKIDELTDHIMFLHAAVLHPAFHRSGKAILDAAFKVFGEASLAAMWHDLSGMSDKELADLGFCKIAKSKLIFRNSSARTPFSDRQSQSSDDDDTIAKPEHEAWVIQEWKS